MNTRTLIKNSIVAALYIAISLLLKPIAFGALQFRVPEAFNHLVVFNKKYFFGIVVGVFITNLFSELGVYDLFYGVLQSIVALSITMLLSKLIKNNWALMIVNTLVFSVTMFFIALELHIVLNLPFLGTWLVTAIEEFIVMIVGMPIMMILNKRLHLEKH